MERVMEIFDIAKSQLKFTRAKPDESEVKCSLARLPQIGLPLLARRIFKYL
jgi:hypothetical protein